MAEPQRARATWVDLRGIQRLAERAVRDPKLPAEAYWRDRARPLLGPHWPLLDHEWHRRRRWSDGGEQREETDHTFTRYALLPDARLVRADWSGTDTSGPDTAGSSTAGLDTSGTDPSGTDATDAADGSAQTAAAAPPRAWRGQVRGLTGRDIRTLDERTTTADFERGSTRTWGTRPSGEIFLPWPGAGVELLLRSLAR